MNPHVIGLSAVALALLFSVLFILAIFDDFDLMDKELAEARCPEGMTPRLIDARVYCIVPAVKGGK